MNINTIVYIAYIVCGIVLTGIPAIIKIVYSGKKLKQAKTNEEKQVAIAEMEEQAKVFIEAAEIAYKDLNDVLKSKGSSAGPVKLDSVLMKLQSLANEKGYDFDAEFWTNKINSLVALTKSVNVAN